MRLKLLILFCFATLHYLAQDSLVPKKNKYDRREEIIYDGKRYRIHNHYLSIGPGFLYSNIRTDLQKSLALDYQFPIRRANFQIGAFMSGEEFASDNNIQGHIGYGFRKETNTRLFAAYVGHTYSTGVEADAAGLPKFYNALGSYVSVQGVIKFAYDIGLGAELFAELNTRQSILGLKLIAFFSGAYRGPKKNYNPHVRSENPG
jgi:hypothetical protein